jgi:hypothetical protein
MIQSKIDIRQPEPQPISDMKLIAPTLSPTIGNTNVSGSACPFEVGEIAVFESWFRFEKYISRVHPIHIEYWGHWGICPFIYKATIEQKKQWWNSGEYEVMIEDLHCH